MKNYIEFLLCDVSADIEYTIQVPEDTPAGEVAKLLAPHLKRCIIRDVTVKEGPDGDRMDECMEIVFNTTHPCEGITEEDAARIISELKEDGWDVPDILTPALFVELYNDLEPEGEDE